ncbi:MAG: aminotransferase class I/II-fold pyridoxal phosphate-dependent enzyme [Chthoniobacterales bacterium]
MKGPGSNGVANNPTASITPKDEVKDFITKTPPEATILVDEAHHHSVESPDYESVVPLIKDHPNPIVARTFSNIYVMVNLKRPVVPMIKAMNERKVKIGRLFPTLRITCDSRSVEKRRWRHFSRLVAK